MFCFVLFLLCFFSALPLVQGLQCKNTCSSRVQQLLTNSHYVSFCFLKSGFPGTTDLTAKDLQVYYLDRHRYIHRQSERMSLSDQPVECCVAPEREVGSAAETRSLQRKRVSEMALVLQEPSQTGTTAHPCICH